MPSPIGSSIAAVAVLEMKAEIDAAIAPKAMIRRYVDFATPGSESTRNANRRSRPWVRIAWAMMKAPMNRKIVSEPNDP